MSRTSEEREPSDAAARLCDVCGQSVSGSARFCQSCGARVVVAAPEKPIVAPIARTAAKSAPADDFEDRESAKLAKELYKEHMRLVEETASEIAALDLSLTDLETRVRTIGAKKFSDARTREVQDAIEEIEKIGDRWEEVQHGYNRESEGLDESFVDRAAEMEIDFELPPERREKLEAAMGKLSETMGAAEARIEKLAGLADLYLRQPGGRWFRGGAEGVHPGIVTAFFLGATAVQFVFLRSAGLAPQILLAVLLIPWFALAGSLFLKRR